MSINSDIEVIVVNDIRQLPKKYIPYTAGTILDAKQAILNDQKKQPEQRKLPAGINRIYHFVSLVKTGWQIIAIDPVPAKVVASIVVGGEPVNVQ